MAEYDILKFSYNWNGKLFCTCFTSIRLESRKYEVGKKFRVFLKENHIKDVETVAIKPIKLADITPFVARLDTGYNVEETKDILRKMYPKVDWMTQTIYFMLFKTIDS